MKVSEEQKKVIMTEANKYRLVFKKFGWEGVAERYKQDCDCEFIEPVLTYPVFMVSQIYIKLEMGEISRDEALKEQKSLFEAFDIKEQERIIGIKEVA